MPLLIEFPIGPWLVIASMVQLVIALVISALEPNTWSGRFIAVALVTCLLNTAVLFYIKWETPAAKREPKLLMTHLQIGGPVA